MIDSKVKFTKKKVTLTLTIDDVESAEKFLALAWAVCDRNNFSEHLSIEDRTNFVDVGESLIGYKEIKALEDWVCEPQKINVYTDSITQNCMV